MRRRWGTCTAPTEQTEPEHLPFAAVRNPGDLILDDLGGGAWGHDADRRWWGFNGLFGGYLVSLAAVACEATVADATRPLRGITMQFLRPAPDGRIRIDVTIEQAGRSVSFLSGRMSAEGKLCAHFLATAATDQDGQEFTNRTAPDVAAFADTPRREHAPHLRAPGVRAVRGAGDPPGRLQRAGVGPPQRSRPRSTCRCCSWLATWSRQSPSAG